MEVHLPSQERERSCTLGFWNCFNSMVFFFYLSYMWNNSSLFEDTKGVTRGIKSKDMQCNDQKTKDQTTTNDLQNTTQKTKHWETLISGCELMRWGIGHFCSMCGTCRVSLATNLVVSHEWGKNRIMIMTNGTYPWSSVTQILRCGFDMITSTKPLGILGSAASLLAATLY